MTQAGVLVPGVRTGDAGRAVPSGRAPWVTPSTPCGLKGSGCPLPRKVVSRGSELAVTQGHSALVLGQRGSPGRREPPVQYWEGVTEEGPAPCVVTVPRKWVRFLGWSHRLGDCPERLLSPEAILATAAPPPRAPAAPPRTTGSRWERGVLSEFKKMLLI